MSAMNFADLPLTIRFAARDLRAGTRGFRLFIACLALGVAAIAGVGSIGASALAGIAADAKALLGGDLEIRLTHREATPYELSGLQSFGRVSHVAEMRAMAKAEQPDGEPGLVELKAVDQLYPLYGRVQLQPSQSLAQALARQPDRSFGAIAHPQLMQRLNLKLGDHVSVGDARLMITATLKREPDSSTQVFVLGPRLMVRHDALAATGLIQPGTLIYHEYRIAADPGVDPLEAARQLNQRFPEAGWRVRQIEDAGQGTRNFLNNTRSYLELIGLSALLIGGLGIANAVRAHLESKARSIAILKSIGGTSRQIIAENLTTIAVMSGLAIAIGLALGGALPYLLRTTLSDLDIHLLPGLYPRPLARAATFGALVALAFSLPSLLRAARTKPAQLFRAASIDLGSFARADLIWIAIAAGALVAFVVGTANNHWLALGFSGSAAATLLAFRGLAWIAQRVARSGQQRLPSGQRSLRFALAAMARPNAPVASIVLSIGLGLTVLISVALIQASLLADLARNIPEKAPSFYFIDIQPDQVAPLQEMVSAVPGAEDFERVPMLRGRIVRMNDTPADQITAPPDLAWVLRGDRGLTWSVRPPKNAKIVEGEWWPEDYDGEPLISLDAETAQGFNLKIGDSITVNLLGREFTGRIANFREIDWSSLDINFVMIFSPGLLEQAPQTNIATIRLPENEEVRVLREVTQRFPNISAIRVKDALASVAELMSHVAGAVHTTALATLAAGMLVLAGAVATGREKRIYEAVLLKMLGGRRWDVAAGYLWEYGLLAMVSALLAVVLGAIGAYIFLSTVLETGLEFAPLGVAQVLALALILALGFGFWSSWRALGAKSAPYLRNE